MAKGGAGAPAARWRSRDCPAAEGGFTYLAVIFAVALLGLLLAGAGQVWHTAAQREKEAELLFVGNQYRQAIASYYERTPGAAKQYPEKLEDLLEDRRFPMPVRHLRQLYRDPLTGEADWALDKVGSGIVGVHSRSAGRPLKTAFSGRDAAFAQAERYDQWRFVHEPESGVPATGTSGRPAGINPAR